MSLATLRAHVWKGGADVMLYYKSNGRKKLKCESTDEAVKEEAVVEAPPATPSTIRPVTSPAAAAPS